MLNKKTGLIALLSSVAAAGVWAGAITNYTSGDVLVCFRSGGLDMVVDAGPVSQFTTATHNQRITINQYTGTQLAVVGTNGLSWSAFTWTNDALNNTILFVTKARSPINAQSLPWNDGNSQSAVAARMATIPPGALDYLNLLIYPQSTSTAVIEDNASGGNPNYTDGSSYYDALFGAYGGNFNGTFTVSQGNIENTTAGNFTTSGTVARSDFYQMTPSSAPNPPAGTWLGYFELNTNGVMSYVAYPTTTPLISTITYSGTTATIGYKSGLYGTYNLLGTNKLSAPVSTWPVIGGSLSNGTASFTVQDTGAVSNKFYIIEGQ
jgi:hypothetical protein